MTLAAPRRVLCLSGSLRRVSANTAVLEAARVLAPPSLALVLHDGLAVLPWFNPDDEHDPLPPPVIALRKAVGASDALLVACPEYAHGVPGAFKNLLDWLVGSLEFPGKPVALINASGRGSHHAQDALAEILRTMSATLLDTVSAAVPLSGAGCEPAQILAQPALVETLGALLARLDRALAQA
ncbi:NADPH-dependent FMN reductase [Dyella sp.]|jgi:NAD(P)H-dependent FMN reductase|uniref:NADPH-dependent FMN reductase n=1 Tax=Dyella sp. TaxID=1869338 RepID=UPI002D766544|nr:NADPH-dependent FMN reductase [Dyella sp.]HET6432586.1 NADPH-dependent FMN reductase [Dyella sp.]